MQGNRQQLITFLELALRIYLKTSFTSNLAILMRTIESVQLYIDICAIGAAGMLAAHPTGYRTETTNMYLNQSDSE